MADLSTTVDGLKLPNPFVIGSGPPGTNANVIGKAFDEGWGAVICKTVSLDASKVINVQPRYARLRAAESGEIIGWENIELISDREFSTWIDEFKQIKDRYPDRVLIASIMEEYRKDAWIEIVRALPASRRRCIRVQLFLSPRFARTADGLGHGRKSGDSGGSVSLGDERRQGAGVGQDDAEHHAYRRSFASCTGGRLPGYQRDQYDPQRRRGVNLDTLRPEPTVEGHTTLGGYSCKAIMPIALRMCMEIARLIRDEFAGRSLSGIGGVESRGGMPRQFLLLGCDTPCIVCTYVAMKTGYRCIGPMLDELAAFMDAHFLPHAVRLQRAQPAVLHFAP